MREKPLRRCVAREFPGLLLGLFGLSIALHMGGCPTAGQPLEFIAGSVGDQVTIGDIAAVTVISPTSDLAITGGTPVQVNWRVTATTRFAAVDVIFDVDENPDNDNEITADSNLTIDESSTLLDTTDLDAGTYLLGVVLREVGRVVAYDYAAGRLIVNQRPRLYFDSPRDNYRYDRSVRVNPSFFVSWTVYDPDNPVSVQIFLDPDDSPNGNEILLRESDSQTGDSFSFDFPTADFEAGTYRILALASDEVDTFPFYAPASIQLRSRLSGYIDLRDMHLPASGIQGAIFEGFNPRDNAGSFVTGIGDIDTDGFGDLFLLAQFGKPEYMVNRQRTGIGEGYLIYGRRTRFAGVYNLNSTGTLFRGEIFGGVPEVADPIRPTRGITSFALMTDWDGDGVRELAFGIPFTDSLPWGGLDTAGYFRSGSVVVAAGAVLGDFAGQNVHNLAAIGTAWVPGDECDPQCIYGFVGPKAPNALWFYRERRAVVPDSALGCRISTLGFGDQCGDSVSILPFYGGYT